ncbi:uncharacterized protein V6R79_000605 [Siganus canaliculatus]
MQALKAKDRAAEKHRRQAAARGRRRRIRQILFYLAQNPSGLLVDLPKAAICWIYGSPGETRFFGQQAKFNRILQNTNSRRRRRRRRRRETMCIDKRLLINLWQTPQRKNLPSEAEARTVPSQQLHPHHWMQLKLTDCSFNIR